MYQFIFTTILLLLGGFSQQASADDAGQQLVVYKSPTCGCCTSWIKHMKDNGFRIKAINKSDGDLADIKLEHGITGPLQSCHTAVSASGMVFEGHVPAGAVKAFLSNPPKGATGLTVPGMPAGSPGMEMGSRFNPYQVVQINGKRAPVVYMDIKTQSEQYRIGAASE